MNKWHLVKRFLFPTRHLAAIGSLLILPVCSSAQVASRVPETSSLLFQTLLGLTVVVCMIITLGWLARRMNLTGLQRNRHCRVVATMPVSAREKVVLVDIGGQQLLLGVAPGSVTTLHAFDKPIIEADESAPTPAAHKSHNRLAASSPAEFSKKLAEFLGQGNRSS